MLLALDISTSCTGYCLFDENGLVDIGYISLSKKSDMQNLPDSNVSARKFLPLNYKVNLARAGHTIDVNIEVI